MGRASPAELAVIVVGSARLPKSIAGEQAGVLMVEIALDSQAGRVIDVATSVPLPGYAALLRALLVGLRVDEVERAAQELRAQLRGPLLRPTIAALASAVSNSANGEGA